METLVKRFLQKTSLNTLTAVSFAAGTISVQLLFLNPVLQFIVTSLTTSIFLIGFYRYYGSSENFNLVLSVLSILTGLSLNFMDLTLIWPFLVVFPVILALNHFENLYLSAITAHIGDLISTWLLLPTGTEENIVVRKLIENLGILEGLIISKTVLIGLPLIYSYRYLEVEEKELFLKIVFVLGLSMAFRNFLVYSA